MRSTSDWVYIFSAVAIGVVANSISAIWARGESKYTIWLALMLVASPLVFISFGLTTARVGLAVGSGAIDSLLTLGTIVVGLTFFREWEKVTGLQCLGMVLAVVGVFLMLYSPKTTI